jgi:hypothetical protein
MLDRLRYRVALGQRFLRSLWRGYRHVDLTLGYSEDALASAPPNPLLEYFLAHREGRGIWKFKHYLDIYNRHFSRFRSQEVHVLEIGVYSGGSLEMWPCYFGRRCRLYGVDIEPACKAYEAENVRIFIGDQSDHAFWKMFKKEVPILDIVIDDGGHYPEQQIVSVEELLPHIRPGGFYACEDIHGPFNWFSAYLCGLVQSLNAFQPHYDFNDNDRRLYSEATPLQASTMGIYLYPYLAIIEKSSTPIHELVCAKRGTLWEPWLT